MHLDDVLSYLCIIMLNTICWPQWLRGPRLVVSSGFRNLVLWLLVLVWLWIYIYSSFYVVLLRKRSPWDWLILHVRNPKKYLLTVFLKQNKTGKKKTFLLWKSYMFSVCVCAWAVLYCHQWRVWLYHILPFCLISDTIFGKMLLNKKCVF
jgi:hypothetical protein